MPARGADGTGRRPRERPVPCRDGQALAAGGTAEAITNGARSQTRCRPTVAVSWSVKDLATVSAVTTPALPAGMPAASRTAVPSADLGSQEPGLGHRAGGAVRLENAVRRGAPCMHHPLRDALVIEVGDLLPQVEVFEQRGAAVSGLQRVVSVRQAEPLGGGEVLARLRTLGRVG